ncbi:NAD(P)H-binding protein [Gordonia lacunae]|uniref:NmrA family transcriptional regulator n=1 Tax=Gordonia lacunae TaxID=417102 RepID=A0A243QEV0_9ACTN|nr:NAD(P)H-binding protein [Gordonia lacunae]OUC79333.1 NmrA family transcriptional regulator [Gordonia lacunae]
MPQNADPATSRRPLILVTGATGNVGREITDRLVGRGARVRGFGRSRPEPRSDVEWAIGDLANPADVRAALTGVTAVFLIWPLLDPGPARLVINEFASTTARVVYLSSTAVDDNSSRQSDPIAQVHADMEGLLRNAALDSIVLRSDTLAANARGWVTQLRRSDEVSGPDIARTAVVDERDVAEAAVTALLAPRGELGKSPYCLTGPEILSRSDQLARLGAALHRPLRFRPLSAEAARLRMLADGQPEALVAALICASVHRPASDGVTDHVERLTGRPARTFTQWATDHADEFE